MPEIWDDILSDIDDAEEEFMDSYIVT